MDNQLNSKNQVQSEISSISVPANAFASKNLTDSGFICNPDNYCVWEKNAIDNIGKYVLNL